MNLASMLDNAGCSAMGTIRARTRELHVQMESRFDPRRAFESRQSYAGLLTRYLGVLQPIERAMDLLPPAMQGTLSWAGRRKSQWLEGDLEQLGESGTAVREAAGLPPIVAMDEALGALYVVEGSCLGGQHLYREVNLALGVDATSGARFFYGYGEATGSMWRAFQALLEREVGDPNRAADSACALFAFFEKGLLPVSDSER